MGEGRYWEISFRTVDDLRRNHLPRCLFEDALAVESGLQCRRAGGSELHQLVIEERHSALETPGHRHVVHPFERVVYQHHGGVQAKCAVDAGCRSSPGEVFGDEPCTGIVCGVESGGGQVAHTVRAAVEEGLPVGGHRTVERAGRRIAHRGIPVIAGEHLVGALAGPHHLDVLGDLLGQQVKRHAIVADHRLAHGADRTVKGGQHPGGDRSESDDGRCRTAWR